VLNGSLFSNTAGNDLFNNSGNLLNSSYNNLTKDFEAQYLIRPDGNLRARYAYRVLNSTTLNTIDQLSVQYVNAVGLVYQKDFDTFGEFLKNFFGGNRRKNQPQPVKPAVSDSTAVTPKKENTTPDKPDGGDED
jgi:hypothetical protein